MSKPVPSRPVKLLFSILTARESLFAPVLKELTRHYGKMDYLSSVMNFDYSNYYEREMGSPLVRRFVFFEKLMDPEELPEVKINSNALEGRFLTASGRMINLDPGYLAPQHLILATGKGYAHRPYLRAGIYADLTLIYQNGAFASLPWTYPDYAAAGIRDLLASLRRRYLEQLKNTIKDDQ
jgi:hypothetical protein